MLGPGSHSVPATKDHLASETAFLSIKCRQCWKSPRSCPAEGSGKEGEGRHLSPSTSTEAALLIFPLYAGASYEIWFEKSLFLKNHRIRRAQRLFLP